MYLRHGSLTLSVVCFARLSIICHSIRTNAGYEREEGEECLHVANESKSDESDFESLVLEDPSFSFLQAQEFFLSDDASCERTLDVKKPLRVPMNEKSKRAQLQQRYVVKHIKDSLTSMAKMDASKTKDLRQNFLTEANEYEEVPAVELHMYPGSLDVNSTWRVLLIPRIQELFGETVYLCKAESSSPETSSPCVAKLTFKRLPLRLMHLLGRWRSWSPSLDPLRRAPHKLLLSMELLLLAIILFMLWHVLEPLQKLLRMAWDFYNTPKNDLNRKNLVESSLPKMWMLLEHAYIYKAAGEAELVCEDALDACTEVKVLETMEAKSEQFSFLKSTDVWGRIEDPAGWIVLVDSGDNLRVICKDEPREVPFCANVGLLVPFSSLLRRQLVLAASHTSVQWFLLESLAKMFGIGEIMFISVSLFLIHLAVVFKIEVTNSKALEYEEVLETKKKLLELQSSRKTFIFLIIALVVLFSTVVVGLVGLPRKLIVLRSAFLPCISLVTAVVLHLMDFRTSLCGIEMWRSPQLKATECTFITSTGLKSVKSEALEAETLSKSRRLRLQVVRLLTWLLAIGALSLLILIVFDGVQMRGELVDYSFGRGYITTPPHSLARQNSLLLHSNVDSLPFTFSTGPFTSEVKVRLEHPLLEKVQSNQSVPVFNQSDDVEHGGGEYSVPLPSGPLYGRLIVEASSHLYKEPTRYVIHLIRIGEAVTVSLKGQIDIHGRSVSDPPVFEETRRWHYQEANPRWYVPDLDVRQNTSIQLESRPTIFAPLAHGEPATGGYLSMFADECHCGNESAGFGNACAVQQWITFPSGASICLFQHHLKEELVIGNGPSFISSNASKLTTWLLDVNVSGKSAGLRLTDSGKHFSVWPLKAEIDESKLRSVFTTSMQTNLLFDQASQLVLAPTEDLTDAEMLAVPLEVISHPPRLNVSISDGFLLPNPLGSEERADLAACCVQSLDTVSASVEDSRFEVIPTVVSKGLDCSGRTTLKIKELKVVRKQNTSCEPWCTWYRPWSDYYDMSVTLSLPHCFDEAIALENVDAFNNVTKCAGNQANEIFDACGTLRNAVYLNRTTIISEILTKDADPDGGDNDAETPLEAAASHGNIVVMQMLLDANANLSRQSSSGSKALVAGVLNCQREAVKFLLKNDVDPNSLTKSNKGSRCQVTPLLALFEHRRSDQCQGENATEIIKVLVEHGAHLSIPASDACKTTQTALVLAVGSWDASAVEELLGNGANPNEPGRFLSGAVMEPFAFLMQQVIFYDKPLKKAAKIAELLGKAGANVNVPLTGQKETALHLFADVCNVEGVELLLELKALPNIKSEHDETAKEGAEYGVKNKCKSPEDKERLIKAFGLKE